MSLLNFIVRQTIVRHGRSLAPGAEFSISSKSSRVHVERWLKEGKIDATPNPMQLQAKPVSPSLRTRAAQAARNANRSIQPTPALAEMQQASAGLEELMRKAVAAAGCADVAEFKRLPASEQNDFLAQARGLQRMPGRDGVQQLDPATIERSPFNREIDREEPETLELVASVKERGVMQNGVVRPVPHNPAKPLIKWQLIAGERRWLAATIAGVLFPAAVRDVGDIEAMEIQGEENFQRKDLNPMEEARTFQQLRDAYIAEGASKTAAMERLEARLKKKQSIIYERLTLLELPEKARELVSSGRLPASHAALLPKIHDPKTVDKLAAMIANAPGKAPIPFRETQRLVEEATLAETSRAGWQRLRGEYLAKGWQVLSQAENARLFPWGRNQMDADAGFISGEWQRTFASGHKTWTKAMGKHAPNPMLAQAPDGSPVIVYARAAAMAAVDKNSPRTANGRGSESSTQNAEKAKAAKKRDHAKMRRSTWTAILKELVANVERAGDSEKFLRAIAAKLISRITSSGERAKQVVDRRGLREDNQERNEAILKRQVEDGFNAKELRGILIEALAWDYVPYDFGAETKWQSGLTELCAVFGVDLAEVEKQVHASGNVMPAASAPVRRSKARGLSPEARAKMAAAMKARWAKQNGKGGPKI